MERIILIKTFAVKIIVRGEQNIENGCLVLHLSFEFYGERYIHENISSCVGKRPWVGLCAAHSLV